MSDAPDLTTGQLAARLRRLCVDAHPDEAAERLSHALEERRVELRPDPAGSGHIFAFDLDPLRAAEGVGRVDKLARSLKVDGETRTLNQLRADVFRLCCATAAIPPIPAAGRLPTSPSISRPSSDWRTGPAS